MADKYAAAEEAFVRETMDRVEQSARAARELAEDLGLPPEAEYDIHAARYGRVSEDVARLVGEVVPSDTTASPTRMASQRPGGSHRPRVFFRAAKSSFPRMVVSRPLFRSLVAAGILLPLLVASIFSYSYLRAERATCPAPIYSLDYPDNRYRDPFTVPPGCVGIVDAVRFNKTPSIVMALEPRTYTEVDLENGKIVFVPKAKFCKSFDQAMRDYEAGANSPPVNVIGEPHDCDGAR